MIDFNFKCFSLPVTKVTEELKLLPTPVSITEVLVETTNPTAVSYNDRTASISKDDIEMMRGRALNINNSEHKRKSSGILYVTAPTTESLRPRSRNTFVDGDRELSDVSMDDDETFDTQLNKGKPKFPLESGKNINLQLNRCLIY